MEEIMELMYTTIEGGERRRQGAVRVALIDYAKTMEAIDDVNNWNLKLEVIDVTVRCVCKMMHAVIKISQDIGDSRCEVPADDVLVDMAVGCMRRFVQTEQRRQGEDDWIALALLCLLARADVRWGSALFIGDVGGGPLSAMYMATVRCVMGTSAMAMVDWVDDSAWTQVNCTFGLYVSTKAMLLMARFVYMPRKWPAAVLIGNCLKILDVFWDHEPTLCRLASTCEIRKATEKMMVKVSGGDVAQPLSLVVARGGVTGAIEWYYRRKMRWDRQVHARLSTTIEAQPPRFRRMNVLFATLLLGLDRLHGEEGRLTTKSTHHSMLEDMFDVE